MEQRVIGRRVRDRPSVLRALAAEHPGAGASGRRDRGDVGPPRRRHRAPAHPHPRVRRPRWVEHRVPIVRGVACLAGRYVAGRRQGARAGRERPEQAAPVGRGVRPRAALVLQGACPHSYRHPGDGGAPACGWTRRECRARGAHRPGLAEGGPERRGPAGRPAARRPHAPCLSGRRRHGHGPWPPDSGSRCLAPPRSRRGSRGALSAIAVCLRRPDRRPPDQGRSSRPTRWACSRRPPCITSSTREHRASAIRSWFTSTLPCWRIRLNPANPSWKRWATFPRERRSASHAMPAEW